ncbi:Cystatin-B [Geodia barretti]|uniref:Cystatin-B n=1 Tax=Geodia barretti TaxID=519541 RepID=A0AA35T2U4_GEOBA|nr:Cystatin-B [Geodia barretti]
MSGMTGGVGEVQCATDEVKEIAEKVRGEAETKTGRQFSEYVAVQFCSQVVAGTNFFIKVQVSEGGECIHLRVYRDLQQTLSLSGVLTDKTLQDPLKYF